MGATRQVPSRSRPPRRTPPLLVAAAAGLVLVIGLGVVTIVFRSGERRPAPAPATAAEAPAPAPTFAEAAELPRTKVPAAPAAEGRPAEPVPATTPSPPPAPDQPPDAEVPVWARRPTRTTQPFPEGGRINPPLPPVRIPAWMLPQGIPDGATTIQLDDRPAPPP